MLISLVEWSNLNTDMRKFESSQKDESRAQSADSSKACRNPSRVFNCLWTGSIGSHENLWLVVIRACGLPTTHAGHMKGWARFVSYRMLITKIIHEGSTLVFGVMTTAKWFWCNNLQRSHNVWQSHFCVDCWYAAKRNHVYCSPASFSDCCRKLYFSVQCALLVQTVQFSWIFLSFSLLCCYACLEQWRTQKMFMGGVSFSDRG